MNVEMIYNMMDSLFQSGVMLAHKVLRKILADNFISPDRARGSGVAYIMVGLRCPSTLSKDFFSKTTGTFLIKFHIHPPGRRGMKVWLNDSGHMTKMAAMPKYGKNLKKSSSSEP